MACEGIGAYCVNRSPVNSDVSIFVTNRVDGGMTDSSPQNQSDSEERYSARARHKRNPTKLIFSPNRNSRQGRETQFTSRLLAGSLELPTVVQART